jgi:uncharacterized protein YjbI with pentapeptide repeats
MACAAVMSARPSSALGSPRTQTSCVPRPHADLRGCDYAKRRLEHVSFAGSDLRDARFTGADASAANFSDADLSGANLTGANLTAADVESANLTRTVLTKVVARSLRGRAASLPGGWVETLGLLVGPGVDLRGAPLSSAILPNVDLRDADLVGADLQDADLVGADLHGAALSDTNGTGLDVEDADLSGARISNSVWVAASAVHSDLAQADFSGSDLTSAQLTGSTLTGTVLADVTLWGVGSGALKGVPASVPPSWKTIDGYLVGPGAALGNAQLGRADLRNLNLSSATLVHANLTSTNLSGGNLSGADLSAGNFTSSDLADQTLTGATLSGSALGGSTLDGSTGSNLVGSPASLPASWAVANNQLVTVPSELTAPTNFNEGAWIESSNGQFTVEMQADGNLVEYQGGVAIWATGTSGSVQTVFQGDCNLVVYEANEVGEPAGAIYTTGTGGGPDGCTFSVANDGSLAVTTPDGTVRWARYADGTIFTHRIQMTQNAPVFNQANTSSGEIGTIPTGDSPSYVCWTESQPIGNVNVWFYVLWDGEAGYYPSYYDNSVYSYDARISIDYGIPACGSVPTTFTPPSNGTTPVVGPATISAAIEITSDADLLPGPSGDSGAPLAVIPTGASPGFLCWTTGEVIAGVDVWFEVYWAGTTGYYASGLDNSSYSSDAQITSKYGIPSCSGGSGPVTPPAQPPTPSAPSGPYVQSNDPSAPYAQLLLCPKTSCSDVTNVGGQGVWLPNGSPVSMLCWMDDGWATVPGHTPSDRWFAVFWRMGAYAPIYAWVFSNLISHQATVPNCSDPAISGLTANIV